MLWKACEAYGALGQGLLIGFLDKKYRVAVNLLLAVTRFLFVIFSCLLGQDSLLSV